MPSFAKAARQYCWVEFGFSATSDPYDSGTIPACCQRRTQREPPPATQVVHLLRSAAAQPAKGKACLALIELQSIRWCLIIVGAATIVAAVAARATTACAAGDFAGDLINRQ